MGSLMIRSFHVGLVCITALKNVHFRVRSPRVTSSTSRRWAEPQHSPSLYKAPWYPSASVKVSPQLADLHKKNFQHSAHFTNNLELKGILQDNNRA